MTWFAVHWSRLAAGTAILTVAAVAGIISYTHIYGETLALHQPRADARLMPFGVDGLMVVGSVVLLQSKPGQRWLGWLGIGPGVAISLFANVMSGVRYGWLSAVWAGIPAIAFFLACFILENWLKAQTAPQSVPVPEPVPVLQIVPEAVPANRVPVPLPVSRELLPIVAKTSSVREIPARTRVRRTATGSPETVFAAEIGKGEVPSIRVIKAKARVGTDRARDIRKQLAILVQAA